MKLRYIIFIGLLVVVIITGIWFHSHFVKIHIRNSPQKTRTQLISKNLDFLWRHLKKGMTKEEVHSYIGYPQNENNDYVWMWIDGYESFKSSNPELKWQNMYVYSDGYFLLFFENRLLCMVYSNSSASPIEIFASKRKISLEVATEIIKGQ